ncbi:protein phosphatase [Lithospermum erythrorhizon]|uniref:Protein phosphatase n=1 Tax=Lithospermum erythrorhizon TaxID=34254 RepID=A0AAV3P8T0_LITER
MFWCVYSVVQINEKARERVSSDFGTFLNKFSGGGLHQTPGRLLDNGSSFVGSLYSQQGKKRVNQDAMIVWENYWSRSDTIFCGVFDGHVSGQKGCELLNEDAAVSGQLNVDELLDTAFVETTEHEKFPEMHLPLKRSMIKAFKLMDLELKMNPIVDCFCSGSTAVAMVKQGQDIIIGNIGDSRAVLATREKDNSLRAVQLTVDLKPNLPRETARIQKCKSRVFALLDEPDVARVWLPHTDSPGLAMARAFGDFCLKDFGLISIPVVYYHHIADKDEFVILASDGVWDVLSNKEAVDIVSSAPSHATAARALVDYSTRAWRLKYLTSKTDDCAVVCLFLEHTSSVVTPTQFISANNTSNEMNSSNFVALGETLEIDSVSPSQTSLDLSGTIKESSEIVPVDDTVSEVQQSKSLVPSKRSLAECLSTAEEDEWSALEGLTRANSLLSLPRFLSIDIRSASWRRWL